MRQNLTKCSLVTLLLAAGCGGDAEGERSAAALEVRVGTATQLDGYEVLRPFTGELRARRASDVGVDLSGRITELLVDVGDEVEAGNPLAHLDVDRIKARLAETEARRQAAEAMLREMIAGPRKEVIEAARARVERLRSDLDLAGIQRDRRAELRRTKVVSQEDLDAAQTRYDTVNAQLAEARAQLSELENGTRSEQIDAQQARLDELDAAIATLEVDVTKSTIVAPFDGTIAARLVDEGRVVAMGSPLFRLIESGPLEAWIGIRPSLAQQLIEEPPKTIVVDGRETKVLGARILPEIDESTRTATLVLDLTADDQLRPGQIARIQITRRVDNEGFWIPIDALTKAPRGLWAIKLVVRDEDGQRRIRRGQVEVLHTTADRVFVRGTLRDGDEFLVDGAQRVVDGQRVTSIGEGRP